MLGWVVANIALACAANACMKIAAASDSVGPSFVLAFLLNSSSFVVLYFLLQKNALATNQVLVSSGAIVASCVIGFGVFRETFGALKCLAIALALLSIFVMYYANVTSSRADTVAVATADESL